MMYSASRTVDFASGDEWRGARSRRSPRATQHHRPRGAVTVCVANHELAVLPRQPPSQATRRWRPRAAPQDDGRMFITLQRSQRGARERAAIVAPRGAAVCGCAGRWKERELDAERRAGAALVGRPSPGIMTVSTARRPAAQHASQSLSGRRPVMAATVPSTVSKFAPNRSPLSCACADSSSAPLLYGTRMTRSVTRSTPRRARPLSCGATRSVMMRSPRAVAVPSAAAVASSAPFYTHFFPLNSPRRRSIACFIVVPPEPCDRLVTSTVRRPPRATSSRVTYNGISRGAVFFAAPRSAPSPARFASFTPALRWLVHPCCNWVASTASSPVSRDPSRTGARMPSRHRERGRTVDELPDR